MVICLFADRRLMFGEIRGKKKKPKLLAGKPYYSWAAAECVFPLDV